VLIWLSSTFTKLAESEELMTLDDIVLLFDIASKCQGLIDDKLVSDSLYCMSYTLNAGDESYLEKLVTPSRIAFFVNCLSNSDENV